MIRIIIEVDMNTGHVGIHAPIEEMRIMHYALGEALRICKRRADDRDAAAKNGSGLVVAHVVPKLEP